MNAYIDGAGFFRNAPGSKKKPEACYVSWGVVFEGADVHAELSGAHAISSHLKGCHEVVAFVEAALYLSSHGYAPGQISFISDDETVCYGSGGKTRANGYEQESQYLRLQAWLAELVSSQLYTKEAIDTIQLYVNSSRFHKIKGHHLCVLNHRCDYLAKKAAWARHFGTARTRNFDTWSRTAQLTSGGRQHAIPFCHQKFKSPNVGGQPWPF